MFMPINLVNSFLSYFFIIIVKITVKMLIIKNKNTFKLFILYKNSSAKLKYTIQYKDCNIKS